MSSCGGQRAPVLSDKRCARVGASGGLEDCAMLRLARALWADQNGFVLSAELVIVATTVVLGLTVALVAVRDSITGELTDLANAFRSLDQSYYTSGFVGCRKANGVATAWTPGSAFFDPHLRTSGPQQEYFPEEIVLGGTECPVTPRLPPVISVPAETPCPPLLPDCPTIQPEIKIPCEVPVLPQPELPGPCLKSEPVPCPQPCQETVIPCFSCCPGTNGHLAPMPLSTMPCCVGSEQWNPLLPPEYSGIGANFGSGFGSGVGGLSKFYPAYDPYAPVPTGPLQVW